MEVGLEGGSRWFKQGLEVGCKEEVILGILGRGGGATLEGLDGGQGGSRGVKWVAKVGEGS